MVTDLARFVRDLPKAELHVHIEGTLEPDMVFALADRNGVELPYGTVDELRRAYAFDDLQSFLDVYYRCADVLRTEQDFRDLTTAYLERAVADGVRWAEIFFDPQTHTGRGVGFDVFMPGLLGAIADVEHRHGMSAGLVMCFLRHLPAADAMATFEMAAPWYGDLIGVGLDSGERDNPPERFADVFAAARAAGLHTVAHAGEEGPASYVAGALDHLGVERIDHGVRCEDDDDLVDRLVRDEVPLTMCPLSNLALRVVGRLDDHNLARLLRRGVRVTVNSDDPAYFGGYVVDNYVAIAEALQLSHEELRTLARNSLEASFAPAADVAVWCAELDSTRAAPRRIVIAGAGGRDFHNHNTIFRDDPGVRVVAFTATQIPGIDDRRYPPALAGPAYPDGIPIVPEDEIVALIDGERVDEVVFSYSDVSHEQVMHLASRVLAAGASFRLLSPRATMLPSPCPVVAVVATRTGAGKSPTSRRIGRLLVEAGRRVALIRHPMPYGDLSNMQVQRFASIADIDAAAPTIEEREEYEEPVRQGMVVFAGVDYARIVAAAAAEADVIVWDGGNNDTTFIEPALTVCVVDPLRPDDGRRYHPGETNLVMADAVVVNKTDSAEPSAVDTVLADVAAVNPDATVIRAASPVTLDPGPDLAGRRVLVVEDGPTLTHGGMAHGAGTIAARQAGAGEIVDPRPWAVGSLAATFAAHPHLGPVLPAMGYGEAQLADLAATVRAVECDVVVIGTPIDLARLADLGHPIRRARYTVQEIGAPDLRAVLAPIIDRTGARTIDGPGEASR